MSNVLNMLPPSLREALEQYGEEVVAEQINVNIQRERAKDVFMLQKGVEKLIKEIRKKESEWISWGNMSEKEKAKFFQRDPFKLKGNKL